jgi:stage II sporulation protein M
MLELLINPKRAERKPWQMFFVGFFYAAISILAATFIFGKDPVLSKYVGIFIITFCVIFSMPFMYYTIKLEERKDLETDAELTLLKEHGRAISSFLWLFLGFILAFSIMYVIMPNGEENFRAQIETFCQINRPASFEDCIAQYGLGNIEPGVTGAITANQRLFSIFSNNIYVLLFTIIFSLIFGAGAIFILAWNATVISAAIGIFIKSNIASLPLGIMRYMIHGLPEIAAYFISALAGGILSVAVIRHDFKSDRFWSIMEDVLTLIILSLVILFIAALIEVFITPKLF